MKKAPPFFTQFGIGITSYFKAVELLFNRRILVYLFYILLVSAALVAAELYITSVLVEAAEARLLELISPETFWVPLRKIIQFVLRVGLHFFFYYVFITINKYLLLIVLSPLMSAISEKAEAILTGREYPFALSNFFRDIRRGVIIALRNMFIEFGCIFLGLFVVWIPVIGWFCPVFLFLLSCYFYGFSMIDYINERRALSTSQSITYVKAHKGLAIGNGFILVLLFTIPFLGVFLAAIMGPVAATVAVVNMEKS